jgi:hypothetical protein
MKLFKRKYEFKIFGIRIVIILSTYRYGYKRGEKLKKPDENQMELFPVENIDSNCI